MAESIPDAVAVLDDLAARRCAQSLHLPIVGTLGLILRAKQKGLIAAVGPVIDAILAAGLYISPRHIELIRSKAGEST